MSTPTAIYQQRIDADQLETNEIRRKLRFIPWLRLLFFLVLVGTVIFFIRTSGYGFIVISGLSLACFITAGWYDSRCKQKILKLDHGKEINRQEIAAIRGDFSAFDSGIEFKNEDHPYTNDLDVFGIGSLFQCVNRTSTQPGKQRLADYFLHAYRYSDEIIQRQNAVRELAEDLEFRQDLQTIFFEKKENAGDLTILFDWLGKVRKEEDPADRYQKSRGMKFLRILSLAGPACTLTSIFLSIPGLIPYQVPFLFILGQMLIVFALSRRTLLVHQNISRQLGILQKYSRSLRLIEETGFESALCKSLQDKLRNERKDPPSMVIKRLARLLNWMDENLNMVVSAILNGLFLFNIHLLLAVESWRRRYSSLIPAWFDVLAEFDALAGLGAFSFNHPDFVFPQPGSGDFHLVATEMGHPLILEETCVTNDIEIRGWNQFRIITGANMSGKSTFLRAIGTNLILAMIGAPVFAGKFSFTPVEIHSSIRTNDSLVKGESYFYSELKRLKEIILELQAGSRKLILLDEILKGTNSSDKQSGSVALIKQLMKYQATGIFATHDVSISNLVEVYPENIRNLCFEIFISDDRMEIDYKLRPGVCRNLNASYLMKKMGIVGE